MRRPRNARPVIVVLNGPAGVGKTTVGRRLAATARNGICIHGDALRTFVVRRDPGPRRRGLTYRGAAALADAYVRAGFTLVVFEYVFEHPRHLRAFTARLQARIPVRIFTLWAPLAVVRRRERARIGRRPLGPRVTACWRRVRANLPALGEQIDATGSVARVVRDLRRRLAAPPRPLATGGRPLR